MHCEDVHYYLELLKHTLSLSEIFRGLSFIVFSSQLVFRRAAHSCCMHSIKQWGFQS